MKQFGKVGAAVATLAMAAAMLSTGGSAHADSTGMRAIRNGLHPSEAQPTTVVKRKTVGFVTVNPPFAARATVACPDGYQATYGGYTTDLYPDASSFNRTLNGPRLDASGTQVGWITEINIQSAQRGTLTVYVNCRLDSKDTINTTSAPAQTSSSVQTSPIRTTSPVQTSPVQMASPVQTSPIRTMSPMETSPIQTSPMPVGR
ncbi:hypothetical protein EPA93_35070 [Ktedonosporobacter rubrisoli]|uniref:Uncharacterized protein n=1 Tax=Ktedonosporobacter rubrisoli TaxID=2509675 RepID=A0A4P6JZJ1_KTERU|nr:hypothetical protein [Ktedonosporobacter rubrisoli]QBD80913.1 hypothetical protein EPA93_35070 [Ktedonosporobacter rubrisoli]